ncbi:MAG TPA: acyltransferase [Candidatus Cybelea sp.]|jgi:peptidoglycan/LPS O-acetylase OafA/YrhL
MAASGTLHGEARLGVLDGLRGLAVLLVLWYHVWEFSWLTPPESLAFLPATGFVGVILFFFLSGFVISYPFVRSRAHQTRRPSWANFAWRRFIKIVPSYALSIAVAYAIGYAQLQPDAKPLPDLTTHFLFVHTWFPNRFGTINGVLWTLAIEVEFYFVFPLIWWLFARRPYLVTAGMIAIAWIWRVSLAHCCYSTLFPTYEENLPGYLDIFGFGMISAHLFVALSSRPRPLLAKLGPLIALAGFVMFWELLVSVYGYRFADQWAGVWQIERRPLLGLAFALIALGSLVSPKWWQLLLDNPPLRFLATISYNLYLYHQMVARQLIWHHVPPYQGDPHYDTQWQVRFTGLAIAVNIALATVVTYCFERPLLRLRGPRGTRSPIRAQT